MRPVVVRADASSTIGIGHIARCLSLAGACRKRGSRLVMVTAAPTAAVRSLIEQHAGEIVSLAAPHPDPADLASTCAALGKLARDGAAPWLVADGYHFDEAYHAAIRQAGWQLLAFDDGQHLGAYHADVLLNQNVAAERLEYAADADTQMLLGARYALLRPEVTDKRIERDAAAASARKVLITFGGADPGNVTLQAVHALNHAAVMGMEAVAVIGSLNPHRAELEAAVRVSKVPVQLRIAPADLASLMLWADLAIGAGGSTCWELLFLGVPMVIVPTATNQRRIVAALAAREAAVAIDPCAARDPEALGDLIGRLCRDPDRRERMRREGQRLIDGRGTERVAASLDGVAGVFPSLRRATLEDAEEIWKIANDPAVRRNAFRPEPIPLAEHLGWYTEKLKSPVTAMWVLAADRRVTGQIRYEWQEPGRAVIGFSVAAGCRGQGLGIRLLASTWLQACKALQVESARGYVFPDNQASIRAFDAAGFQRLADEVVEGRTCAVFERRMTGYDHGRSD